MNLPSPFVLDKVPENRGAAKETNVSCGLWMTWVSWHLADNCGTHCQNLPESGNPPSFHVTLLFPREKKIKVQTFAQGNSKRPVQAVIMWELGKKGLCKYWHHELQHSLLAALGSDKLHSPPAHLAGSALWVPFPFPRIVTKCGKIWKGLNHGVWSNWQGGDDLRVNMWNQREGEQAADW